MGTNKQSGNSGDSSVIDSSSKDAFETTYAATDIYQNAWKQLFHYTKSLESEMGTRFRKRFNQSLIRYELLSQLFEIAPSGLPIGQLAQRMMGSNGNITGLVDRMIVEGLVEKSNCSADRRSINIGLTAKGTELCEAMDLAHADWAESLMQQTLTVKDAKKIIEIVGDSDGTDPY